MVPVLYSAQDKTTIETYTKWDGSNTYSLPWYSDSGYCKLTTSGDGYCADCWYDQYDKRTYRAQYKHYGDLNVIVEEGYMVSRRAHVGQCRRPAPGTIALLAPDQCRVLCQRLMTTLQSRAVAACTQCLHVWLSLTYVLPSVLCAPAEELWLWLLVRVHIRQVRLLLLEASVM